MPHATCLVLMCVIYITPPLEFASPRLSNPNIGVLHAHELENTHEMPPKKRPMRGPPAKGSSQGAGGHVLATTEVNNPTIATTTNPVTVVAEAATSSGVGYHR
jgi:hypothetical protein